MILLTNKYLKMRHRIPSWFWVLFKQIKKSTIFNLLDNYLILNAYNKMIS